MAHFGKSTLSLLKRRKGCYLKLYFLFLCLTQQKKNLQTLHGKFFFLLFTSLLIFIILVGPRDDNGGNNVSVHFLSFLHAIVCIHGGVVVNGGSGGGGGTAAAAAVVILVVIVIIVAACTFALVTVDITTRGNYSFLW